MGKPGSSERPLIPEPFHYGDLSSFMETTLDNIVITGSNQAP